MSEAHLTSSTGHARNSPFYDQSGNHVPAWVEPTPQTRFDRGRNALGLVSQTHRGPISFQSSSKRIRDQTPRDFALVEESNMLKSSSAANRLQNYDNYIHSGNPLPEPVAIYAVDYGHHQTTSMKGPEPTSSAGITKKTRSRYKFLPDGSIVDFGLRIRNSRLRHDQQRTEMMPIQESTRHNQPTSTGLISSSIWSSTAQLTATNQQVPDSYAIPPVQEITTRRTFVTPPVNTTVSTAFTTRARKRLINSGIPVGHLAMDDSLSYLYDDTTNKKYKTDDSKKTSTVNIPTLPLQSNIFTTQVAGLNFTVLPTSTTERKRTTTTTRMTTTTTTPAPTTTTTPKPTQHPDDVYFYSQGGGKPIKFIVSHICVKDT